MKIKELIAKLQQANPEEEVYFNMWEGCCGNFLEMELDTVEHYDEYNKQTKQYDIPGWINIYLNHLPGYYSCRQSGKTLRDHDEYWKDKPEYLINKKDSK